MQYIKFIFIGTLLFFVFRFIPRIIRRVLNKKNMLGSFTRVYPFVEFILWTAFIFWAVQEIFRDKFYFTTIITGIVIIVMIIFGYYVLRDFAAGMVLKAEYIMKKGKLIKIGNTLGTITNPTYLSLELETNEHEKIKIPYSKISGEKIIMPNPTESLKKFVFNINVQRKINIISTKKQLEKKLLNTVWTAVTKKPDIKLIKENLETYDFKIIIFAQNENHAERIKQIIDNEQLS